jgi:hypothetical protein
VPFTLEHDPRRGWLLAKASGTLTLDEVVTFLRTARAGTERQMVPLLVDARDATTGMTDADVDRAVAVVEDAVRRHGLRGHAAIIADDDRLYAWMLRYEARCAEIDVRIIRVFRQAPDAERWLEAVASARHFR